MTRILVKANLCAKCGAGLLSDAEGGLCPACLLESGLIGFTDDSAAGLDQPQTIEPATASIQANPVRTFGDYELLEEIARGGMGVVYRARQRSLNRIVAVKMILSGQFASKQEVLRFRGEAEAAANLRHPNIVAIYETGEHEGQHFFSMDFIAGRSLAEIVRESGPLPAERAARYVRVIAEAIHYAHQQGTLHRDLKPSNVIIDANDQPRITDFGLAKRVRGDFGLTVTGQMLGSPSFMPPEQCGMVGLRERSATERGPIPTDNRQSSISNRKSSVGPWSDVYGLGAILYHLLTGRPPFQAQTTEEVLLQLREKDPIAPRWLNPSVPRDLETITLKCLEKEPRRRYASADALAKELELWLAGRPILTRRVTLVERLWLWSRRNPAAAAAGILLMALALVTTMAAFHLRKQRNEANQNLWASYLAQAQAQRMTTVVGRRTRSLDAVSTAARMRPSLELRNEAIAALALIDLERPVLWRHGGPEKWSGVDAVLLAPDFDRYAVFGSGAIALHNAKDGRVIEKFQTPPNPEDQRAFSPDGRFLMATFRQGRVFVWDLNHPETLPQTNYVTVLASSHPTSFSSDSRSIAVAGRDRWVRFYGLLDGDEYLRFDIGVTPRRIGLDHTGKRLAVLAGSTIHVWDTDRRERLRSLTHRAEGNIFAWHPKGRFVLVGYNNGDLVIWDTETGDGGALPSHSQHVNSVAFDPRGEFLASDSWDGTQRFWDPSSGRELFESQYGSDVQFSRDGRHVSFLLEGGGIGVREIIRSSLFRALASVKTTHPHLIAVDLSRDGRWLVFGERKGWHLWDLAHGKEVVVVKTDEAASPLFDGEGRFVVAVSGDRLLRWPLEVASQTDEVRVGPAEALVTSPGSRFEQAQFSRDGELIAVVGSRRSVLVNWKEPSRLIDFARGQGLGHVSVSIDNRWVAAASTGGAGAAVWNVRDGTLVRRLITNENAEVAFSLDNRILATATPRECVWWDTATWQARRRFPLNVAGGVPVPIAFSRTGDLFAIAATRHDIRLIDTRSGQEIATLTPPAPVALHSVVFSANGRYLAAHTFVGTVHLWDLQSVHRELAAIGLDW